MGEALVAVRLPFDAAFTTTLDAVWEAGDARPLLLLGFAALPIRGVLFMVVTDPQLLVAVQVLDGICAAVFGVLVPLTIADITRGTGRYNLAQGIVGSGIGTPRQFDLDAFNAAIARLLAQAITAIVSHRNRRSQWCDTEDAFMK